MESPSPVSPKSFPAPKPTKASPAAATAGGVGGGGEAAAAGTPPIAIVPGWQVTWSDWFASRVDIHDAYSPTDHWQWGATLWRNVVGADVTVAVQAPVVSAGQDSPDKVVAGGAAAAAAAAGTKVGGDGGGGGGGLGSLKDGRAGFEKGRGGGGGGNAGVGVEVRLEDARAVIVRGERDGGVAEGGLRRVGFEIGEWVRGWEEREEMAGRRGS